MKSRKDIGILRLSCLDGEGKVATIDETEDITEVTESGRFELLNRCMRKAMKIDDEKKKIRFLPKTNLSTIKSHPTHAFSSLEVLNRQIRQSFRGHWIIVCR